MNNRTSILPAAAVCAVLGFSACQPESLSEPRREGVSFTVRTVDAPTKSPVPVPVLIPVSGTDEFFLMMEEALLQPDRYPADAPATKASIHPEGALAKGAELGLVAYTYETDKAEADTWTVLTKPALTPLVLDDSGATGNRTDGSGKWIPAPSSRLLWPREGFVRFFAFAPYSAVSGTFTDSKAPVLAYTVPADVAAQVDLLVGTPRSTRQYSGEPDWQNIDVPMNLQHALTGVRFRIVDGLSIDNVTVSGVYGAGELDLTAAPLSWTLTGAPDSNYSMTSPNLVADSSWSGFSVTDEANTFLLMPQVLPADAKIEVIISMRDASGNPVPGSGRTISVSIAGQEWKPGTRVTYTITR